MQHIFYEPSRNIQLKFLTIIRIYQVVQYNPVPLTIKKLSITLPHTDLWRTKRVSYETKRLQTFHCTITTY